MKKTLSPRLVADDNGYADHKIAYFVGDKIECKKFPTSIQVGGSNLTSVSGDRNDTYQVVDAEGAVQNTYTCSGAVSQPLDLRNAEYPFGEPNRVLLHHAMTKAGLVGMPVKVGLTLPFGDFYKSDGTYNKEIQLRATQNFSQANVVKEGDGVRIDIASAHVFPEAMSAFYDWGLEDDGTINEKYEALDDGDGSMLVVDIGGSTTDIVCVRMINGELMIDHGHSGTNKIGVLDVKEQISKEFQNKYSVGHEAALSPRTIARIMETGTHQGGGRQYDLRLEVQSTMRAVAQRVVSFVQSKAGALNDYQAIHFVGGGAVVFRDALSAAVPFATVGDEFANARGVLKYLVAQQAN